MPSPIFINEYDKKVIPDCDLEKLHKYIKCKNLDSVINVTPIGIQSFSYVGVIKYKNTLIEILPKIISRQEDSQNILRNLIYMLSYTRKLNIKTNDNAMLSSSKNPFLEILIREYAKSLFECLQKLTPKTYVTKEKNLDYLKGKINFSKNIKYNSANQAKFYCEYSEYSDDNDLNRLFLFVSTCLYNITKDKYNKKILQFIINYYSDIKLVCFNQAKTEKIKLARNQELFKKPFNMAKMFVENSSIDFSKNKFENITLIWDMNVLFEEFVYEIMKKSKSKFDCEILEKKKRKLFSDNINNTHNTFVDILIEKNNKKVVLDTKYKKFMHSNNYKNQDVNQVSTYCLLHNAHDAILLYPQWDDKKPDISRRLNTDNKDDQYIVHFKTINLKYDYIGNHLEDIRKEVDEIFSVFSVC